MRKRARALFHNFWIWCEALSPNFPSGGALRAFLGGPLVTRFFRLLPKGFPIKNSSRSKSFTVANVLDYEWCEALSSDFPSWAPFGPFRGVLLGVWPGPLRPKVFPIQLIDMIKSFLIIPLILYVDFEFSIDFFRGGPQIPAGRRVWGHFGVIFRKINEKQFRMIQKAKKNQILSIFKP